MNIAILGFGTVGSGVYEVAGKNGINVKRALDIKDFEGDLFTKNFNDILYDPEIGIIVESIGGLEPAYEYTKAALTRGKSVVSSNKELVAARGAELSEIAAANNVYYLFEASVGGGTPVIRPLRQCLAANRITEIYGILNGTANYILTRMAKHGESFATALADAQAKGYAELDPAADVEGRDTCRKIAILASLAFGKAVSCDDIPVEGITRLAAEDIRRAEASGSAIKLIGRAKEIDGEIRCEVKPELIPLTNPLANINYVFNAIVIRGDSVGEVMFCGPGAGKLPTASAVMADVIEIMNKQN